MKIMRKFIRYYRPYWKVFLFDMICAMGISVIDLAFPQILNYLNATLYLESAEQIKDAIVVLLVILLVMYTVRALCKYYVSAQGHIMGAMMERDMRKELFDQYERLSFSYYDRNNTGEMMSRLVSDLFDICEFAHHGPENVFISLLKIIGSFILLMYIHVPLTILLMIVTIGMLLFSLRQNRRMQETFMENRRKIAGVNASLQDTLAGIRAGAKLADASVNGLGDRAGNVSLVELAAALEALYGAPTGLQINQTMELSKYGEKISGVKIPTNKPIIGENVFTDQTELHFLAQSHQKYALQGIDPEIFGAHRSFLYGKLTSDRIIALTAEKAGVQIDPSFYPAIRDALYEAAESCKGRTIHESDFWQIVNTVIKK